MGNCCHDKGCALDALRARQGRILWIVLAINVILFLVELAAGIVASFDSMWPDFIVGALIAVIFLCSAFYVIWQSLREWQRAGTPIRVG
jgi:Co/Zn/Cd efflux system component